MTTEPTRRDRLETDRDALEAAIAGCESLRDLPSLIREHRAVLAELDALPNQAEVSSADEIAARRASRRSGSSRPSRAKRSS